MQAHHLPPHPAASHCSAAPAIGAFPTELPTTRRELVEGFDALAAGRTGLHPDYAPQLPLPADPAEPASATAAAARAPQLPFLRQLCGAMAGAGYRLLSRQEWEAALCENFMAGGVWGHGCWGRGQAASCVITTAPADGAEHPTPSNAPAPWHPACFLLPAPQFTLPVTASYCSMDASLLPAALYAAGAPAAGEPPPQLAGRALIWHRGAEPVGRPLCWAAELHVPAAQAGAELAARSQHVTIFPPPHNSAEGDRQHAGVGHEARPAAVLLGAAAAVGGAGLAAGKGERRCAIREAVWRAQAGALPSDGPASRAPHPQVGLRRPARQLPGVSARPYAQPAALDPRAPDSCAPEPALPAAAAAGTRSGGAAAEAAEAEEEGRVIERRTFARAFPDGAAVWRQLTRPVVLQEACFQDVVLLYRPEAALAAAAKAQATRRSRPAASGGASGAAGQQEGVQLPDVEGGVGGVADEVRQRCWR